METPDTSPPEREPRPQVHLLSELPAVGRRIRHESLEHYVHAVMRTIDDFLTRLPEGPGMDFRAAVAILPDGQSLVNVEFRPELLAPDVVGDIERRVVSLSRPPVREGPVAFLAFWLARGGSNDPRDSFRHQQGPNFRLECPHKFAQALNAAETAARPRPPTGRVGSGPLAPQGGQKPTLLQTMVSSSRTALRRIWSAVFPATAASGKKPLAGAPRSLPVPCHRGKGPCKLPEGEYTLDDITQRMQLCPDCGKLYAIRARLHGSRGQFELAIADYTRQIELGTDVARGHFSRGVCYRLTEKPDKALEDFHEAVWLRPRWAEAIVGRAWAFFALGKPERALEDVNLAVELDPDEPNWRLARARLLASLGRFDEAMADLNHALRLDPHNCDALFLRASVYRDRPCPAEQAKADFEASLADFTAVLRLYPDHAESCAARASIRMRLEDVAGALADCEQALQKDPECILAYRVRGKIRQQQGKLDAAIDDFSASIRLAPADAAGYTCRAEAYAAQGKLEEVVADANRAIEIDAHCAPAFALRGLTRFQQEQFDQALADCSEAIRLGFEFPNLYLCRANVHFIRNRLAQAMLDCNHALRVAPGHVDALSARGMVRTRLGLFREALSDFNQAVRQAPELAVLYLHRGNAYGTLEDHQAALDDFGEAIRLDPEFAVAYYSRAVAWLHLGDNTRAAEDCDEAIRRDADCAPAHFLRARLLDQLGVSGAAIASYNDAIRLAPDFAAAYAGRANAWVNSGDYEQAIADYCQAIHREPAAGQMLGQLDEEYAVEAVVRGLADAEPGRGNLFLAGFLARGDSLDEALDQCEAALEHLPAEEVLGVAVQVVRQHMDEAGPELFQRIEAWFQRAKGPEGGSVGLDLLLAYFRDLECRYTERCEIYRRLIDRPDAPAEQRALACNNLAYFLAIREEDVRGALELADRAIELTGPYPEYLDTRGVVLLAAGRFDEAVAELRRAVGNKPTGLRLYHLARACYAAGDAESAQEAWEEAHRQQELTLEQIPFYEQQQYRATAEVLEKEE